VSDAVHLVTTVVAVKELRGGVRAVVVDSGINILPTSFWKFQDIECVDDRGGDLRDATVYGPLCLQTDIIGKCMLPELKPATTVVKNVRAYNIPSRAPLIFPRPPIVIIEEGKPRIVRRARPDDFLPGEHSPFFHADMDEPVEVTASRQLENPSPSTDAGGEVSPALSATP
jgi:hypothetical protein